MLKSVMSQRLKERFSLAFSNVYWEGGEIWAREFFASTVGSNEATIRNYVRYQGEQKIGQAQLEC